MDMLLKSKMERSHLDALYYNATKDAKYFKYASKMFADEFEFLGKLRNNLKECAEEYMKYRNRYDHYETDNLLKADKFFNKLSNKKELL